MDISKNNIMGLNLQAKDSWIIFDSHGMPLVKGDELSWKDSLGRLILIGLAYGFTDEIIAAIESCYHDGILYRHPAHNEEASRDHKSYFLIYREYTNQSIPDFPFMRGLYLWMHSLTRNRLAEFLYYMIYIPGAIIGNVWLRICRWVGRINPERNNNWWILKDDYPNWYFLLKNRTKWQKLWAWIIFQTIPAYPLHNRGWQLYVMPDSKRKERLKRILLRRVGKSNILLRLLFGDIRRVKSLGTAGIENPKGVTQQDIDNYPHMTGFRPGVYLDETCRRTIRELTAQESEFNAYEKALIKYLYDDTII